MILFVGSGKSVRPKDIFHVMSPEEVSELILEHQALAFLPRAAAWRISRDDITIRPLSEPQLRLVTNLAVRSDTNSRLVKEFVRAISRKMTIASIENHIKQLHGVLLKYGAKDQDHRGQCKKVTNYVEAFGPDGKSLGVVFETATPFETPGWMKDLVDFYNRSIEEESHHPLILIGIVIVAFLAIHPFKDGNGRLSRVLATLLLLRAGYDYVPYSSMESVIEQNEDNYYLALRRTQQTIRKKPQNWEY